MARTHRTSMQDCWYVLLTALAFWIWLGKDLIFEIIPFHLPVGRLILIILGVFVLLSLTGKPTSLPNRPQSRTRYFRALYFPVAFIVYCALSTWIGNGSAFSIFKLQSLILAITLGYILCYKTVRAIAINKTLFFLVGLFIGIHSYYFVFSDLSVIMEQQAEIGLRAKHVAHLNIQDFFILLFLYATSLLFASRFYFQNLLLFVVTAVLSAPIVIGMNSRMVPFTIGLTLLYMVINLPAGLSARTNLFFNIFLSLLVAVGGAWFFADLIAGEARMMQVFSEGPLQSFVNGQRYISFAEAWKDFLGAPIFGIGFGQFIYPGEFIDATDRLSGFWPHNIFLELLSELGLVGFVLFFYPFGRLLARILSVRFKNREEFRIFPGLLLVYIFLTMQLSRFIAYPVLWVGYFLCYSAFYTKMISCETKVIGRIEQ